MDDICPIDTTELTQAGLHQGMMRLLTGLEYIGDLVANLELVLAAA